MAKPDSTGAPNFAANPTKAPIPRTPNNENKTPNPLPINVKLSKFYKYYLIVL
jgi:hypothetical protein